MRRRSRRPAWQEWALCVVCVVVGAYVGRLLPGGNVAYEAPPAAAPPLDPATRAGPGCTASYCAAVHAGELSMRLGQQGGAGALRGVDGACECARDAPQPRPQPAEASCPPCEPDVVVRCDEPAPGGSDSSGAGCPECAETPCACPDCGSTRAHASASAHASAPPLTSPSLARDGAAPAGAARPGRAVDGKLNRWSTVEDLVQLYPALPPLGHYPITDKFSLIMLTYKRPNHAVWQMKRMLQVPSLHKFYLIVNDQAGKTLETAELSQELRDLAFGDQRDRIEIIIPKDNHLNNRFLPPASLETETVMWLDDDMEVTWREAERAFKLSAAYPLQLVGFFPRTLRDKGNNQYDYVIPHDLTGHTTYSIILPGGGTFGNARLLHLYSEILRKDVIDYTEGIKNCEDILFNVMASHYTGLPPVYVLSTTKTTKSVKENTGYAGLRNRGGHTVERSTCFTKFFAQYFDGNPLVQTDLMLTPFTFNKPTLVKLLEMTGSDRKDLWHWT